MINELANMWWTLSSLKNLENVQPRHHLGNDASSKSAKPTKPKSAIKLISFYKWYLIKRRGIEKKSHGWNLHAQKIPCGCSEVVVGTAALLSLPSLMSSVLESSTSSSPEPSSMGSLDGGRDGRTVILKEVFRFFSGSMIGSSHC